MHSSNSYTKSQLKERELYTSYQDISYRFSTEFDPTFQGNKKSPQDFLDNRVSLQICQ